MTQKLLHTIASGKKKTRRQTQAIPTYYITTHQLKHIHGYVTDIQLVHWRVQIKLLAY